MRYGCDVVVLTNNNKKIYECNTYFITILVEDCKSKIIPLQNTMTQKEPSQTWSDDGERDTVRLSKSTSPESEHLYSAFISCPFGKFYYNQSEQWSLELTNQSANLSLGLFHTHELAWLGSSWVSVVRGRLPVWMCAFNWWDACLERTTFKSSWLIEAETVKGWINNISFPLLFVLRVFLHHTVWQVK